MPEEDHPAGPRILPHTFELVMPGGVSLTYVLTNYNPSHGCKFVAIPVCDLGVSYKFAILDQGELPPELRQEGFENEVQDHPFFGPLGLCAPIVRHGKYHFYPTCVQRRIDLEHLQHGHKHHMYCQGNVFTVGEEVITWPGQQYSFFDHIDRKGNFRSRQLRHRYERQK